MKFQDNFVFPESSSIVFHADLLNGNQQKSSDLIKLIPFGIQVSPDGMRPILILKDEKGIHSMPVSLNPIEAGVAITQSNKNIAPSTPHRFSQSLLDSLNIKLESCIFTEIRGAHQYVLISFINHPSQKTMKFRADEVMSVCLHLNVPFYATLDYMSRSRVLSAQAEGAMRDLKLQPNILNKTHKYIM